MTNETLLIQLSRQDLQSLISESMQLLKEDRWLTHEEAAEYLRMSKGQLHELKREGKVTFYKNESSLLYKKSDLDLLPKKHTRS
jgi:excisionase family DNA binding protein